MAGKIKRRFGKAAVLAILVLILGVVCVVGWQIRKENECVKYEYTDSLGRMYMLTLQGNGTFTFGNLADSRVYPVEPGKENIYRWEDDILVLVSGTSGGVLYFRQDGDTLVYRKELSSESGDYGILDGAVYKRTD